MELKRAYGLGYLLTFATQNESINIRPLNELICAHVPASKLLSSVGTEVSFSLPDSETSHFEGLFQTIEGNLEGLGVVSYAISVTTIEEVFLRVGDFAAEATQQFNTFGRVSENGGENDDSLLRQIRPNSLKTNSGLVHTLQVYRALLTKKLLFFLRNPFLIYAQGPMPSLLLIMVREMGGTGRAHQQLPVLSIPLGNCDSSATTREGGLHTGVTSFLGSLQDPLHVSLP